MRLWGLAGTGIAWATLATMSAAGCQARIPVSGEWIGAVRQDRQWHAARITLSESGPTIRGTASVGGLGILRVPVTGTIHGDVLQLHFGTRELESVAFSAQLDRTGLHSDPERWEGPALQFFRPVALAPDALAEYAGWYASDTGERVIVMPGSEGGLRFFGLGRLSGTLLPRVRDAFDVSYIDQVPTIMKTAARFLRDPAGRVSSLEIGDDAEEHHTALARIAHPPFSQSQIAFQHDGLRLRGTLFAPADGRRHPALVLAHGTGHATADRAYELSLINEFLAQGIAVFVFDKRGCGASSGDWRTASLEDLASDVSAAVAAIRTNAAVDAAKVGVYGISEGGWIAPIVAKSSPEIAFVINQGGPAVAPLEDELDDLTAGVAELKLATADHAAAMRLVRAWVGLYRSSDGSAEYRSTLTQVRSQAWFQPFASRLPETETDWEVQWWRKRGQHDPAPFWENRRVPTLVLIGSEDDTMDLAKNLALFRSYQKGGATMELRIVDGADHGLRVHGKLAPETPPQVAAWIRDAVG